jgi:hypothetical protein
MSRDLSRAAWRTSSRSQQGGECVEVANLEDGMAVRDSKDSSGPALEFGRPAARRFVLEVLEGKHDL